MASFTEGVEDMESLDPELKSEIEKFSKLFQGMATQMHAAAVGGAFSGAASGP